MKNKHIKRFPLNLIRWSYNIDQQYSHFVCYVPVNLMEIDEVKG